MAIPIPVIGATIGVAIGAAIGGYASGKIGGKVSSTIYDKNMETKCPLCMSYKEK